MATNDALNNSLAGQTGTGSYAGSDSPTFTTQIDVANLRFNGNTVSSTSANGNIEFTPNGSGVNFFNKDIQIETASNPSLTIWSDNLARTSYFQIEDLDANNVNIDKTSAGSQASFRFNPLSTTGSGDANALWFRDTNTSGAVRHIIYKGNGTSTENCRISGNGASYFNVDTGGVGIGNKLPTQKLDVLGNAVLIGDSRTDATNKNLRILVPHYSNASDNVVAVHGNTSSSANIVNIGGGTSFGNAATSVNILAAATTTTPTGTNVGDFTLNGLRLGAANARVTTILDEDTMSSDSATALATQQSIKAYVDNIDGRILQIQETTSTTGASSTAVIPTDNTIPQQTEGTEFFTVSITPGNASNTLLVEVDIPICSVSIGGAVSCLFSLFRDATANAVAVCFGGIYSNNASFSYKVAAGSTSPTTFKLRFGPGVAGTAYCNQSASGNLFGAASLATIRVTEIQG